MSHSTINACVLIQTLCRDLNTVANTKTIKDAVISIVKDDDEILFYIRISPRLKTKTMNKSMGYPLLDSEIFDKFVKEGKATVKLPKSFTQILISNCPSENLKLFIKTIRIKIKGKVATVKELIKRTENTAKLIPLSVSLLDAASPVSKKDINKVKEKKLKDHFASAKRLSPIKSNDNFDSFSTPPTKKFKSQNLTSTPNQSGPFVFGIYQGSPIVATKIASQRLDNSLNDSFQLTEYHGLSSEQIRVIEKVKSGLNVFFTGSAGTGKTYLLKKIIGILPPHITAVTASTGIAASLLEGSTLHSFAGIGAATSSINGSVSLIKKKTVLFQQWRKCKHLIIDEISMVTAEYFDHLDQVGRIVRNCPNRPFGGIQLILSGDFLQLPPVNKGFSVKNDYRFVFQSNVWNHAFDEVLELTQIRRQTDPEFIKVLGEIRLGKCPDWVDEKLKTTSKQIIEKNGVLPTLLCTHVADVERINIDKLDNLQGNEISFTSKDSVQNQDYAISKICQAEYKLKLKIGAQVMLIRNLDVSGGLVNGARGVIVKFSPQSENFFPVVKFMSGQERIIQPEKFLVSVSINGVFTVIIRRQLPLKLAYAISVHKSQGMTLDCAEFHLSKAFECGQVYVALSRCKSLDSIRLRDWNKATVKIKADEDAVQFFNRYKRLNNE